MRVYAIGDIHGYLSPLREIHDKINAHLSDSPVEKAVIVYLGDYIDRGPDSMEVIEELVRVKNNPNGLERVFIKGNHEWGMLGFMNDPLSFAKDWLKWGGIETVASYGVEIPDVITQENIVNGIILPAEYERLAEALRKAVSDFHIDFLNTLKVYRTVGDYMFVHAGIKPNVPIRRQDAQTMMRIRDVFLKSDVEHPYKIVHGHSIFNDVEIKKNRIAVDTGFYESGLLSCVVLEGTQADVIQVQQKVKKTWTEPPKKHPPLKIYLAAPRGFCAGVDRAIQIVERALEKYRAPVYVRHEIVHNKFVVDGLREKGAVFVDELDEIPDDGQPVIFSAHGVAKAVPEKAQARNMFYIDATCPLVSKVHREAERHHAQGYEIVLIGHKGHPEVIGTMGQLPEGTVHLVETQEDVALLSVSAPEKLAYCTQTTLSVDDTASIVTALKGKYPNIVEPPKGDICYATTNRQAAVKDIAKRCDVMFVIGAPNSSNSNRLVEVAKDYGCRDGYLVQRADDISLEWLIGVESLGLTAGASAPDVLVEEVLFYLRKHFDVTVEEVVTQTENVVFNIPKILREDAV